MSEAEQPNQRISRKSGTPYFGELVPNRDSLWLFQAPQQQATADQPTDKNYPQTILEQSSNSSDGNLLQKMLHEYDNNVNTDIELVYVKEEMQLERPKLKRGEKSKSDYYATSGRVGEKLDVFTSDGENGKGSEKVTSSWGVPTSMENSRKKTVLHEKEAEEDCKIYKNGGWTKTILMLTETRLSFFQFSFEIKQLQKIKILPLNDPKKPKPQNILKILFNKQVQLFALTMDKKSYQLPFSYFLFAKLIEKRIYQNGLISETEWQKSEHAEKRATSDSYIYGNIMKRSQVLGNWETRFVVVKKDGIYSYKDSMQEASYSFDISSESIKYIWTRFQQIENKLIIKIKHGIFKTQFGIPLTQFSVRSPNNWLYAFFRTLPVVASANMSPLK